jgi:hypothetical protein
MGSFDLLFSRGENIDGISRLNHYLLNNYCQCVCYLSLPKLYSFLAVFVLILT